MSPQDYFDQLADDRKAPMLALRNAIIQNLPKGFTEVINYGIPSYVVPHTLYPAGYHCTPELPLGFISIASQANFLALYHMGLYADEGLYNWFVSEYPKHCTSKLDMGKSCVRFKKPDDIPLNLIGQLASKLTPDAWINIYEDKVKR